MSIHSSKFYNIIIYILIFRTILNIYQEAEKKRKEEDRKQAMAAKNEAEKKRKDREVCI